MQKVEPKLLLNIPSSCGNSWHKAGKITLPFSLFQSLSLSNMVNHYLVYRYILLQVPCTGTMYRYVQYYYRYHV